MLFALTLAVLLSICCLALADTYVVASTKPNGYCYLYDQPSSVNGRNLGRYDNGAQIEVLDWDADTTYAYVSASDGKVGYMRKASLTPVGPCSVYEIRYVYSTNPNGYCYLYDQPSSVNGTNLGQYNNGAEIAILDWDADENYAKVYTADNQTGYIRKECLTPVYPPSLETYYVGGTPKGYCYMYDQPSSVNGRNLGRYNDGSVIYMLDYNADGTYAYVQAPDGSVGYIRKAYLTE
jgi:hypothetical protein